MPDFRVGDAVILTDGNNRVVRKIDGIRRGNIRVGVYTFDWTGKEINTVSPVKYRIEPLSFCE